MSKNSLGIQERASGGSGTESWKSNSYLARRSMKNREFLKCVSYRGITYSKVHKFQVCSLTNFHKQTPMQLNAQINSTHLPKGPPVPYSRESPALLLCPDLHTAVNFDCFCTLYTGTDRVMCSFVPGPLSPMLCL